MDERRRRERHNDVFRAEVRARESGAEIGLVADISSGGMLLHTDTPLTPGEDLELVVILPGADHTERELPVEARVRWCEEDIAPGTHIIGLAFHGATPPDGPVAMNLVRLLKSAG